MDLGKDQDANAETRLEVGNLLRQVSDFESFGFTTKGAWGKSQSPATMN